MRLKQHSANTKIYRWLALSLVLMIAAASARAQSLDLSAPAPLASNDATGHVQPLDVGDARLTRHYYIFTGGPGDLLLKVESANLDGDVDLFSAVGLRPLLKISMLGVSSGDAITNTSKSVFLRREEAVILRIEARATGDQEGTYHISFTGPFKAAANPSSETQQAPTVSNTTNNRNNTSRRVNSIGARIEEPPVPVAPVTASAPDDGDTPNSSTAPVKESAGAKIAARKKPIAATASDTAPRRAPKTDGASTTASRRRAGAKANAAARRQTPPPTIAKDDDSTAATKETIARPGTGEPPVRVQPARPARPTRPTAAAAPKKQDVMQLPSARLIVEMRDGERIERLMSDVRRLTVEKGVLVIVAMDGTAQRRAMMGVLKVSIEP